MFLKHLCIENTSGVIRDIPFHPGLNLIVDETPEGDGQKTGNNVGKTTVLKLIDMCLGADPKRIYTDIENAKNEYGDVRRFLVETKVLIRLSLCETFESPSERDLVIERNFLSRRESVRRVNGKQYTESEFEALLTNHLFPGHYGKKPTLTQIISHNIRYKEPGVSNTLKTISAWTRDDEYEALYLFLLGVDFDRGDEKQDLLVRLRLETAYKNRLESDATKSQYEMSLNVLADEIRELEGRKYAFRQSSSLDRTISALGDVKYRRSVAGAELARLRLRRDLISEAVHDLSKGRSDIDMDELQALYVEVSERLIGVTRSFSELLSFHNSMIDEKIRYIAKEVPQLDDAISSKEAEMESLSNLERSHADEIEKSGVIEDMEQIVNLLNDRHRQRGQFQKVIEQISGAETSISEIHTQLAEIDELLFSEGAAARIQNQVIKFNRFFSTISNELYGESYALAFDRGKTKTNQQVYRFSCFNTNNFSSGKKQGEITCFDLAYTLFADDQKIPCYHFLLNDKKELMHDNQLARIGRLVSRKAGQIQFVASILRDKLPTEMDDDRWVIVKLSQADKLFRIEKNGGAHDEDGQRAGE